VDVERERAAALSGSAGFATEFVGYETTDAETTIGAAVADNGEVLVKLVESPFYATGGGQVADSGVLECEGGHCRATVTDVIRLGTDQVVRVKPEHGSFEPGERVHAHVDRPARHATACNHTATHLLHASLRRRLGAHVHQAGSYVGPDKLRFDFTHSSGLSAEDLRLVQDDVNRWIVESHPVHAISTSLDEAKRLGAMALFNEKYGEIVRMVEVGDGSFSRELCGGTHVRNTAEIGLFRVTTETSSAANVRRIEAITGPEAVAFMRARDAELETAAHALRVPPERVAETVDELRVRVRELERKLKQGSGNGAGSAVDVEAIAASAVEIGGVPVLTSAAEVPDGDALLALSDRLKGRLGDAAIVLGRAGEGKVDLVVSVAPALVARGRRSGHDGPCRRPRSGQASRGAERRSRGDRSGADRLTP
jgi:alanyl-tRNA synthetase